MADDQERALAELVRHEVEAALRRHGIESEKAIEVARAVSEGISLSKTSGVSQCPQCSYDVQRRESWSDSVSEGESTGYGTSHTEGSAESSGRSRSRSITSQSTTEGTTETETGTESLFQTDGYVYQKPERLFWFVKPQSRATSRRRFLIAAGAGLGYVGGVTESVVANKLSPLFPDLPSFPDNSTEVAKEHPELVSERGLRELWGRALTLKAADMSGVQADATNWFHKYKPMNEADQLGTSTILNLIQELSRQESATDLSHEREIFIEEAMRCAVEAQKAGVTYGPLKHYVQLRQAVLWRQRGGPRSAEHRRAHNLLANIQRDASDFAIQLGVLTERASYNWKLSNGMISGLLSKS